VVEPAADVSDRQAGPKLISALRDPKSRIDQIAAGLASMGRPITGLLHDAFKDADPRVRRAATRSIQKLCPEGVIFFTDIILMGEKKENQRSVERLLRRFEMQGTDSRSVSEFIKQLGHHQEAVRLGGSCTGDDSSVVVRNPTRLPRPSRTASGSRNSMRDNKLTDGFFEKPVLLYRHRFEVEE